MTLSTQGEKECPVNQKCLRKKLQNLCSWEKEIEGAHVREDLPSTWRRKCHLNPRTQEEKKKRGVIRSSTLQMKWQRRASLNRRWRRGKKVFPTASGKRAGTAGCRT